MFEVFLETGKDTSTLRVLRYQQARGMVVYSLGIWLPLVVRPRTEGISIRLEQDLQPLQVNAQAPFVTSFGRSRIINLSLWKGDMGEKC